MPWAGFGNSAGVHCQYITNLTICFSAPTLQVGAHAPRRRLVGWCQPGACVNRQLWALQVLPAAHQVGLGRRWAAAARRCRAAGRAGRHLLCMHVCTCACAARAELEHRRAGQGRACLHFPTAVPSPLCPPTHAATARVTLASWCAAARAPPPTPFWKECGLRRRRPAAPTACQRRTWRLWGAASWSGEPQGAARVGGGAPACLARCLVPGACSRKHACLPGSRPPVLPYAGADMPKGSCICHLCHCPNPFPHPTPPHPAPPAGVRTPSASSSCSPAH